MFEPEIEYSSGDGVDVTKFIRTKIISILMQSESMRADSAADHSVLSQPGFR